MTLLLCFLFFITFRLRTIISHINITEFWQALSSYANGWFFKVLILQLAGLPPMFIFFVKFSFLVTAFSTSTIFVCFLILINLIVGIFYYLQLFKISANNDDKLLLQVFVSRTPLRLRSQQNNTQSILNFALLFSLYCFISFFSGIFFIDLYILLHGILA